MPFQIFTREYVQRLTQGDTDIERHFVEYFGDLLLIKLRRTLRSYQAVEDLRQETFLRVFSILRHKGGIDQPERLGAFVHGVCNNVLLEYYRSARRHSPQEMLDFADAGPDPEAGFFSEERKDRVRRMLETLPAKDRHILRLIFLEERDKDEVCRIYCVDRQYLRVLLHRAKNRLRTSMSRVRREVSFHAAAS